MSDVEASVEMRAPAERVWAVLTDVDRLGDWLTVHDGFEEPPDAIRSGASMVQRVSSREIGAAIEWSVERAEPPRSLVWYGRATGGAELRTSFELSPAGAGTRVDARTDFEVPGGPIGALAGRIARPRGREEAERSLARLRALVEDG